MRNNRSFWFVRRILSGVTVVWAAATFTFFTQFLMPGERAQIIFNSRSGNVGDIPPGQLVAINAQYGFDQSVIMQYGRYIWGLLRGDLGQSYFQYQPVTKLIAEQIGPTIALAFTALATAWVLTIVTTVLFAGRNNVGARAVSGLQLILATLPPYWLATILLVVFAIQLRWFPVVGGNTVMGLVLPTLALALEIYGFLGQAVQSEFTRVLEQPFITSSRMRGSSDLSVRLRHVLRNAALPGITLSGWMIGKLLSGAVLVEAVFGRQGLGVLLVAATNSRDVPVVSGLILVSAALFVVVSLVVDLAYQIIDPRIKVA
ncbi:ABC transporter permease [Rhizobium miluonense]|uniref:Peptide/nickel transport system permease protein n=1 Tax=Rhizobium miluonense TaxID=411945 RepID=A0A1C3XBH2_9HYPH|nr:ABC transporter permease [Rhizobium miluonense]SCB49588.1 peptide/nickel transport system permease protein [Rhizobium miluonense]